MTPSCKTGIRLPSGGVPSTVADALRELNDYLQGSCSAPKFHQAPTYWYSPLCRCAIDEPLPARWMTLDLGTWQQLFAGDEDEPQPGLELRVSNKALPDKVGPAVVVLDALEFEVRASVDAPALRVSTSPGRARTRSTF